MIKNWLRRGAIGGAIWALVTGVAFADEASPLTIFAAASLGEVLEAASADWPGPVRISVAGSGAIARQIDQGAPADVVMLANTEWMDWLDSRGHIRAQSRHDTIGNRLVVVGPPGARPLQQFDVASVLERLGPNGRMAMGEHRSVPAGLYARAWMEQSGTWEGLRPYLAEVDNVRAALALVARGEVPLAVLYASDLHAAPESAEAVWTIPTEDQPRIRYALAAITAEGTDLVDYLMRPEGRAVFDSFGFLTESP